MSPFRNGAAGADDRSRTDDLRITNALLYQLSHVGSAKFTILFLYTLVVNSRQLYTKREDVL